MKKLNKILESNQFLLQDLIDAWNSKCSISQWKQDYYLMIQIKKGKLYKTKMDLNDAKLIINRFNLSCIQSTTYRSGKTYMKKEHIQKSLDQLYEVQNKKNEELKFLIEAINELEQAIK